MTTLNPVNGNVITPQEEATGSPFLVSGTDFNSVEVLGPNGGVLETAGGPPSPGASGIYINAPLNNGFDIIFALDTFTGASAEEFIRVGQTLTIDQTNTITSADPTQSLNITGTETGLNQQQLQISISGPNGFNELSPLVTSGDGGPGVEAWQVNLGTALNSLPNGTYTATVQLLGQPSGQPNITSSETFQVNESRSISVIPPTINLAAEHGNVILSGTEVGLDGQPINIGLSDNQGNPVESLGTVTAANGTWSLLVPGSTFSAIADGNYQITANALNNTVTTSQTVTIADDATATLDPMTTVTAMNLLNNHGFTLGGTESQLDGVQLVVTLTQESTGLQTTAETTTAANGAWSLTLPQNIFDLAGTTNHNGTYDISVTALGQSMASGSINVNVDTLTGTSAQIAALTTSQLDQLPAQGTLNIVTSGPGNQYLSVAQVLSFENDGLSIQGTGVLIDVKGTEANVLTLLSTQSFAAAEQSLAALQQAGIIGFDTGNVVRTETVGALLQHIETLQIDNPMETITQQHAKLVEVYSHYHL